MKKTIVVTGASSGIGRSLAEMLHPQHKVIGLSRAIENANVEFESINVDLTVKEEVEKTFQKIYKKFGKIDVLVNNAGAGLIKVIKDTKEEDWQKMIDVNAKSAFLTTKEIVKNKKEQDFVHIINVGSEAAIEGFATYSAYCAGKFALRGFSQAAKHELEKENIKVEMIHPGDVMTPFMEKCPIDKELMDYYDIEVLDDKYMLRAQDVAKVINFMIEQNPNIILGEVDIIPTDTYKK